MTTYSSSSPHEDGTNALETQQEHARQVYGFWCGPGPGGHLYVFISAGTDPADGAQLTLARLATSVEASLWWRGRLRELATMVRAGVPMVAEPKPARVGLWRRMTAGLRRMLLGE